MKTKFKNDSSLRLRSNVRFQDFIAKFITYILLIAGSLLILVPFAWIVSTSLKPANQIFVWPIKWIPRPILWSNYRDAMTMSPFARYFLNTFRIVIPSVFFEVMASSLVAFSFARLRWRGRNFVFYLMLVTIMLPDSVLLIPKFVIFSKLHLVNTLWALIVPHMFGTAFNIFLMRQYFMTIPLSFDEAAKIDGCGIFRIYRSIILPSSKAVIGIVSINTFKDSWNDFFNPLIYLNSAKLWPISIGLRTFQQEFTVNWNLMMAAAIITSIPILLLFFIAQKRFIQGIVITGSK